MVGADARPRCQPPTFTYIRILSHSAPLPPPPLPPPLPCHAASRCVAPAGIPPRGPFRCSCRGVCTEGGRGGKSLTACHLPPSPPPPPPDIGSGTPAHLNPHIMTHLEAVRRRGASPRGACRNITRARKYSIVSEMSQASGREREGASAARACMPGWLSPPRLTSTLFGAAPGVPWPSHPIGNLNLDVTGERGEGDWGRQRRGKGEARGEGSQ